jgi:ferrochelatase
VVCITLSPQWSPLIMGGYSRAVEAGRKHLPEGVDVIVAGPWHALPSFLDALSEKVIAARQQLTGKKLMTLLTVHSLPRPVVDREPEYLEQLMATVDAVVQRAGLGDGEWRFAYQSAGHTPEEWLTPDLKDLLPGIHDAGFTDVLVVPVQFLADHLEILYDIDVAARDEAETAGLRFHRIELLNTSPAFIAALADVVHRELARGALDPVQA